LLVRRDEKIARRGEMRDVLVNRDNRRHEIWPLENPKHGQIGNLASPRAAATNRAKNGHGLRRIVAVYSERTQDPKPQHDTHETHRRRSRMCPRPACNHRQQQDVSMLGRGGRRNWLRLLLLFHLLAARQATPMTLALSSQAAILPWRC
jgi:hypothetical protein